MLRAIAAAFAVTLFDARPAFTDARRLNMLLQGVLRYEGRVLKPTDTPLGAMEAEELIQVSS